MEVKQFVKMSQKTWIKLSGRKLLNSGDFDAFRKFEEKFTYYHDKEESEEILRFFKFKGELKEGELYYLAQNYFDLLPEDKKGDKNLVISALNNTRKNTDDSDKIIRAMNPKLLEDEDVFTEAMLASSGVLDTYGLFSKELILNEGLVTYLIKKVKGTEISVKNYLQDLLLSEDDFNDAKEFIFRFVKQIKMDAEIDSNESGKIASNLFSVLPRTSKLDQGFAHKYLSILKENNESVRVLMPLLIGVSYKYNLNYAWFKDFKPQIDSYCQGLPYDLDIYRMSKIEKISQGFFNGLYEKNPNILLMLSGGSSLVTKELVSDFCGRTGLLRKYKEGEVESVNLEQINALGGLFRLVNESNLGMSLLDISVIDNLSERVKAGFHQDFLIRELENFVLRYREKESERYSESWEIYSANEADNNAYLEKKFEKSIADRILDLLKSQKENHQKIKTEEIELCVFSGINPKVHIYNADFYIKLCDEKIWGAKEWDRFLERREAYISLGKDLINFILDSVKSEDLEKHRPLEIVEKVESKTTVVEPIEFDVQEDISKTQKLVKATKESVGRAKEWSSNILDAAIGTTPVKKLMWWDWTFSEAEYKKAFMNLEPMQKTIVYSMAKPKYKNDIDITLEMLREASKTPYNFSVMLGYIESELIMDTPKFIKLLEFLDDVNWLTFKNEYDAKNYSEPRENLFNKFLLNDEFREGWFKNFGNATILEEIRSNPNAFKTMVLSMVDKEMRNDLAIVQKEGPSPIVQRKHLKF